jgi:type I restriction enzyme S subunit
MPVDNWQSRILDGCATFFSGGTPSKSHAEFWTGTIPWVSAKDLKVFRLHDAEDHVTAEAIDAGSRLAPAGSTFLLVRGMTLHNDVPICVAMRDMAFNQDIKALQPKPGVDGSFLTYWLLAHKRTLLGSVDFAGHGTGRLNTDTLKAMPVALPPLPEQKAIAAVLGALDDKIELNRQMNATLEAMARALFQSWFVDFDPVRAKLDGRQLTGLDPATAALFSNEFEDSELGPIPKGWRVGKVEDILMFNRSTIDPSEFPSEVFAHYSLPAFDEGRVPKLELGAAIKSQKLVVHSDAVLLSKLNPHIPRIWLPDVTNNNRAIGSTEFLIAQPRCGASRELLFCLFTSDAFASEYGTLVTGTTGSHQRIKGESVLQMKIVIPPAVLINRFSALAKPMFDRVIRNIRDSVTLAAIRDAVLPKLLSGSLRFYA